MFFCACAPGGPQPCLTQLPACPAALPPCRPPQEEISHCAAGVRWLTYLHKLAHEGGSQEGSAASSSQSGCGSSTAAQQAACDAAAGAAGSLSTAMNGISLDSKPAADGAAAGAADAAAGAADAADTTAAVPGGQQCGSAAPHDWRGEAAQHARVEAWFHSLIRRHFHGSLKVSWAGAEAGVVQHAQCCWHSPGAVAGVAWEHIHQQTCEPYKLVYMWLGPALVQVSCLHVAYSRHGIVDWPMMQPRCWLVSAGPCASDAIALLLQPPFNEEARAKAGFGPEWYLPVARS